MNSILNTWRTNKKNENADTPFTPSKIDQVIKVKQTNSFVYIIISGKMKCVLRNDQNANGWNS